MPPGTEDWTATPGWVYVLDRETGRHELVSKLSDFPDGQLSPIFECPMISANGRYVTLRTSTIGARELTPTFDSEKEIPTLIARPRGWHVSGSSAAARLDSGRHLSV